MNQQQIDHAILKAFENLKDHENLYTHWMSVLCDVNGIVIPEEWNSHNLKLMENDVMAMAILFSI